MWCKRKRKRCTNEVEGFIVRLQRKNNLYLVHVRYEVDGEVYALKESLKFKSELIKLGPIPIGQRKIRRLPDCSVGVRVKVRYNPNNVFEAYLVDNIRG